MSAIDNALEDIPYSTLKSIVLNQAAVSHFIELDSFVVIKAVAHGFTVHTMIAKDSASYEDFLINIKPISNL
jgi:hypothetical protein